MNPQVLNLQLEYLNLVFKSPILNLLLHKAIICLSELPKELLGILLELLQPLGIASSLVKLI